MIMEDWGFDKVCKYLDEQLERLKEHEAQEQQQLDDFISMELTGEEIALCKEVIENKREEERLETKRIKVEESIAESVLI